MNIEVTQTMEGTFGSPQSQLKRAASITFFMTLFFCLIMSIWTFISDGRINWRTLLIPFISTIAITVAFVPFVYLIYFFKKNNLKSYVLEHDNSNLLIQQKKKLSNLIKAQCNLAQIEELKIIDTYVNSNYSGSYLNLIYRAEKKKHLKINLNYFISSDLIQLKEFVNSVHYAKSILAFNKEKTTIDEIIIPKIESIKGDTVLFGDGRKTQVIKDVEGKFFILVNNKRYYYNTQDAAINASYINLISGKISEKELNA